MWLIPDRRFERALAALGRRFPPQFQRRRLWKAGTEPRSSGVKKGGKTVIAGDGQVSMGNTVMKPNAKKVRRIGEKGEVIGGFAGATADAFTLFERLERKLEQYNGQLMRAAVELAKDWRTDKYLRNLEALMIVADKEHHADPHRQRRRARARGRHRGDRLGRQLRAVGGEGAGRLRAGPGGPRPQAMQIASEVCVFTNDRLTDRDG